LLTMVWTLLEDQVLEELCNSSLTTQTRNITAKLYKLHNNDLI